MPKFEVCYSVGKTEGFTTFQPNGTQSQWLKTVVEAVHNGQAQMMVESMNGGHERCQVHSVYQIY